MNKIKTQEKDIKKTIKNFFKKRKKTSVFILCLLLISAGFLYKDYQARGATYGWLQGGWSGGASSNVRTHTAEQAVD